MKIELLANYGLSAKGDVLDTSEPIADLLINRKIAKKVEQKKKSDLRKRNNGESDQN